MAAALCRRPVDVYGAGLLSHGGARGDKVYEHAYDADGLGRCVSPKRAARYVGPNKDVTKMRWVKKTEWRKQRVKSELLLYLLHSLGIIRWVH